MVVETSRTVTCVARELNVNETTLGNWVLDRGRRLGQYDLRTFTQWTRWREGRVALRLGIPSSPA